MLSRRSCEKSLRIALRVKWLQVVHLLQLTKGAFHRIHKNHRRYDIGASEDAPMREYRVFTLFSSAVCGRSRTRSRVRQRQERPERSRQCRRRRCQLHCHCRRMHPILNGCMKKHQEWPRLRRKSPAFMMSGWSFSKCL